MPTLIIILALVGTITLAVLLYSLLKRWRQYARYVNEVRQESGRLAFLINRDFEVKATNYFDLNRRMKDDQPHILGNVLHCKTGCDSGLCGTGKACNNCPVRIVIKNAMTMRRHFSQVEATMTLYDEHHEEQETDILADGRYVEVGKKPYIIVTLNKHIINPKKERS
jgi:hypothetical protein